MEIATLTFLFVVLVLAGTIGYFVVWGVTPALHTPLMAVTNAISGIVVVAAMLVVGPAVLPEDLCAVLACPFPGWTGWLQVAGVAVGWLAVVLCAINLFGGFAVTRRMLGMFKKRDSK